MMHCCASLYLLGLLALLFCIPYEPLCVTAQDSTRLDILRERLQRLEERLTDDLNLLRKEFYLEIENLSKLPEKEGEISRDVQEDFNMDLLIFKDSLTEKLKRFQLGLANEKRIRKAIQDDLDDFKEAERCKDTFIANLSRDMTSVFIKTVESFIKESDNSARIISESIRDLATRLDVKDEVNKTYEKLRDFQDGTAGGNNFKLPERVADCADWRRRGQVKSGVYTVFPETMWRPLKVYCDMETAGGGWTVFQRRKDGTVNFTRNWVDYAYGFGDLNGEFWLGNEFVHRLTSLAPQELRIELEDFENDHVVAEYGEFSVRSSFYMYLLTAEFFSGNVTDSLIQRHNGQQFSTAERGPAKKCSVSYKGGWWYGQSSCHYVNINGEYLKGKHKTFADGVNWYDWKGYYYSLKSTEMKFRSK